MSRLNKMKGGGFLSNVDGTLVDYEFTHTFPGQASDPDQIFATLTVLPDGATDPVQTTLRGGSAAYLKIQDAHTVVNPEGSPARIWPKSDLFYFLSSLEAAGVADGGIDESDPSQLSFTSLIGKRMRFVQRPDEERMAARVKAGKSAKRVVEKDGKKSEYDYTLLAVETVYFMPAGASPKAGSTTAKVGGSASAGTNVDAETTKVLMNILTANDGVVQRSQLQQNIIRMAAKGEIPTALREPIRKRIFEESFLLNVPGVAYDQSGKTQTVSLAN